MNNDYGIFNVSKRRQNVDKNSSLFEIIQTHTNEYKGDLVLKFNPAYLKNKSIAYNEGRNNFSEGHMYVHWCFSKSQRVPPMLTIKRIMVRTLWRNRKLTRVFFEQLIKETSEKGVRLMVESVENVHLLNLLLKLDGEVKHETCIIFPPPV